MLWITPLPSASISKSTLSPTATGFRSFKFTLIRKTPFYTAFDRTFHHLPKHVYQLPVDFITTPFILFYRF